MNLYISWGSSLPKCWSALATVSCLMLLLWHSVLLREHKTQLSQNNVCNDTLLAYFDGGTLVSCPLPHFCYWKLNGRLSWVWWSCSFLTITLVPSNLALVGILALWFWHLQKYRSIIRAIAYLSVDAVGFNKLSPCWWWWWWWWVTLCTSQWLKFKKRSLLNTCQNRRPSVCTDGSNGPTI